MSIPFKSEAQRRFFWANKDKLKKQGVSVEEWQKETGDRELPNRLHPHKQATELAAKFRRKHKS